jgi:hypothetical protein
MAKRRGTQLVRGAGDRLRNPQVVRLETLRFCAVRRGNQEWLQ